ncbi:hypothetical protein SAMN02745119_02004 [Trichlorobacter thiogenes]|uniref:Uncharacterized protein n=1 Tax=Trichlorobacter thiogenes TaxID=115783 RepID=A0A1T4PK39_9BACT|nr:hypothetical protein [Trichlorobacter thiogenes]SJZ91944.1 hypothetical protein SAMN02745119_02004 [Trichlorobacter thiogenes]
MIKIIRACSVKIDNVIQHFGPGETLSLPVEKELRIIKAGYAETVPDATMYRKLCQELSQKDPRGGCWDWLVQHQPNTWRSFMQGFLAGDVAKARTVFDQAVTAWKISTKQQ